MDETTNAGASNMTENTFAVTYTDLDASETITLEVNAHGDAKAITLVSEMLGRQGVSHGEISVERTSAYMGN